MKRDKRIGLLSVFAIVFALLAVFLFGKAYFCIGEDSFSKGMQEESSPIANSEEVSQDVDYREQSISVEEFNGLFRGEGELKAERVVIEGVPVNVVFCDNQTRMPLVVMQHGLTTDKDSVIELAKSFAAQGYIVITPDAVGYGELADGKSRIVAEILQGTVENMGKIIDFGCQSEYVDESRVGLCGVSLGALASLYYSAYGEHEIKAAVSFCGTPDFTSFEGVDVIHRYHTNEGSVLEADSDKWKEMEAAMMSLSPYDKLLNEKETALFLMCGTADTVVPPAGNATFYQEALAAGKKVSLVVKENQGHTLELDEMYAALAFMVENL